jgi:hypothetical protein
MKHVSIIAIVAGVVIACGSSREAAAGHRSRGISRGASATGSTTVVSEGSGATSGGSVSPWENSGAPSGGAWHGTYYDTTWGMPVAVVVPPQPRTQTNYGWGIGGNTVTPVQPQFQRMEPPASEYHRGAFRPTPPWPSNTNQFGDYYIRGPW